MLTRTPYYHGITRKMVVGFGGLFSNIHLRSRDENGKTQKIVNVPLAYANKEKFIVRIQQDPALNEDIQISLPRLSFELVGFDYDAQRQFNKIHRHLITKDAKSSHQYVPVPYNLTFNLYSYTKTSEDNFQIMEQILPFFTPDMNVSIKVLQNPDVVQDCTLTLNSLSTDDSYDGSFEDRRYIITTYEFMLQMNYHGPIFGTSDPEKHFEDGPASNVIKKVIVSTNQQVKYSAVVDPFEAKVDEPHTINEGWAQDLSIGNLGNF